MKGLTSGNLPANARIIVWFDKPRDTICIADRIDKAQELEPIPEECIVRIPLLDGEEFFEAVFNACTANSLSKDTSLREVLDGILGLLDRNAAHWANLAEIVRTEISKRSGGDPMSCRETVSVPVDRWIKIKEKLGIEDEDLP